MNFRLKLLYTCCLVAVLGLFMACENSEEGAVFETLETQNSLSEQWKYEVIPGQYIVTLKEGTLGSQPAAKGASSYKTATENLKLQLASLFGKSNLALDDIQAAYGYTIEGFAAVLTDEQLRILQADPRVKSIEPDYLIILAPPPDKGPNKDTEEGGGGGSPSQTTPWGIGRVNGPVTYTGDQKAYILDTGIDAHHEELAGKVIVEKCFVDGCDTEDILGHGTFIAGIIAASDENNTGTEGLAPNSRLMNIKVADDKGRCRQSDLIEGIIWAADNGAQVINISIELHEYTSALQEAIDYAWDSGALIIAAAGNDGNSVPVYPAALENCLSITGIDEAEKRAPLANFGDWVDAAAPGFRIYGIMPEDTYGYQHGTSFATAYASGLAARLFAVATDSNGNGKLNDEVLEAILAGCRELPLEGTGNGLIDVIASEEYLVTPSSLN